MYVGRVCVCVGRVVSVRSWPRVCGGWLSACIECSVDTYVRTYVRTITLHTHTAHYLNGSDIDGGSKACSSATVVDADAMFVHLHSGRPHLMEV